MKNDETKFKILIFLMWASALLLQTVTVCYLLDIKKFFEVIE